MTSQATDMSALLDAAQTNSQLKPSAKKATKARTNKPTRGAAKTGPNRPAKADTKEPTMMAPEANAQPAAEENDQANPEAAELSDQGSKALAEWKAKNLEALHAAAPATASKQPKPDDDPALAGLSKQQQRRIKKDLWPITIETPRETHARYVAAARARGLTMAEMLDVALDALGDA